MYRPSFVAYGLVMIVGFLAPSAASAQAPPTKIVIGAWNIEWLGMPGNRSGIALNVAQSPKDIADYIKASEVSILSLEEIGFNDGTNDDRRNKTISDACALLNQQGGAQWKHRLFPKRDANDKNQHLGVLWNEAAVQPQSTQDGQFFYRVEMKAPTSTADHPDFMPNAHYFDRWATAMKFSAGAGKTDVVVIPVHLKANVGGSSKARKQRNVEASMLVKALPKIRAAFSDDDIIILGDTNILDANESAADTFTSNGLDDLNHMDLPTHNGGAPFDRAFIADDRASTGKNKEFLLSVEDVFHHPTFSGAAFRKLLSDHFLVRLSVDILADDD